MPMHSTYTCEERSDCPDLAEHWGEEGFTRVAAPGSQTAVDAAYFIAFVLGDNATPFKKEICDGKGPWHCEQYTGAPCDCF